MNFVVISCYNVFFGTKLFHHNVTGMMGTSNTAMDTDSLGQSYLGNISVMERRSLAAKEITTHQPNLIYR